MTAWSRFSRIRHAAPPLGTSPSRKASKGRDASSGLSSCVENAPRESNPAIPIQLVSCAPPTITISCIPLLISMTACPMAWALLAHAALMVQLAPRIPKYVARFIDTVEFIVRNILPEPIKCVSPYSRARSIDSTPAFTVLSFPNSTPQRSFFRCSA